LTEASSTGYQSDVPEPIGPALPPVDEREEDEEQDDRSTQDSAVAPEEIAEINSQDAAEMTPEIVQAGIEALSREEIVESISATLTSEQQALLEDNKPSRADQSREEERVSQLLEDKEGISSPRYMDGKEEEVPAKEEDQRQETEKERVEEDDESREAVMANDDDDSLDSDGEEENSQDYPEEIEMSTSSGEGVEEEGDEEETEYEDMEEGEEDEEDDDDGRSDSEDGDDGEPIAPVPASFSFASAFRGAWKAEPMATKTSAKATVDVVDLLSSSSEEDEEESNEVKKPVSSTTTTSVVSSSKLAVAVTAPVSSQSSQGLNFTFPTPAPTGAAPASAPFKFSFPTPVSVPSTAPKAAPITFSFPPPAPAFAASSSTLTVTAPQDGHVKFTFPTFPAPNPVPATAPVPQPAPVTASAPASALTSPTTAELSAVLNGVPSPVKTAVEAFNKIGSKLILATAAIYFNPKEAEDNLTLSEREYDILKGLLDQVKPKSLTVAKTTSTSTESDQPAEKKQKAEILTLDVTSTDADSKEKMKEKEALETTDNKDEVEDEDLGKKIKFSSATTVIRSRLSLDGIGPSSPMDEDNFTSFAGVNKVGFAGTPFNRRASTSSIPSSNDRMFTRQPTPFHKNVSIDVGDGSEMKKKRSFFDYHDQTEDDDEDDYQNDFSAKKRLSVSFDNVSTVVATPASALGSASKRASTGGLDRFSATRLPFVPQFKGTSVQFSTFTAPAMSTAKAAAASNLSYIERRKLHRSSVGSSTVVAKQILEALGTISTPAAEKSSGTSSQSFIKPQSALRIGHSFLETSVTPAAAQPAKAILPQQKPDISTTSSKPAVLTIAASKPGTQPFSSFNVGSVAAPEAAKKPAMPDFNFKLPVNPPHAAPAVAPTVPAATVSALAATSNINVATAPAVFPITLVKSAAPVTADSEFVFEEPMVVTDVDDSITKAADSSICYMFSAPNQAKVSGETASSSVSTAKVPVTPAIAKTTFEEKKPSATAAPTANIWSNFANNDTKKCQVCMVPNKKDALKCVSCESSFPSAPTSSSSTSSGPSSTAASAPSIWTTSQQGAKCKVCLVMNKQGSIKCASCESPLDSAASASKPSAPATEAPVSKFTFSASTDPSTITASTSSGGFKFGASDATTTAPSTSKFSFGIPPSSASSSTAVSTTSKSSGFVFGTTPPASSVPTSTTSSGFTFGTTPAVDNTKTVQETKTNGFQFSVSSKSTESEKPASTSSGFTFGGSSTSSSAPAAPSIGFTFGVGKNSTDSIAQKLDTVTKPVVPPLNFPVAPATSAVGSGSDFGSKRSTDDGGDDGLRRKRRTDDEVNKESTSAPISFNFSSNGTPIVPFGPSSTSATTSFAPAAASSNSTVPTFTFGGEKKDEKKESSTTLPVTGPFGSTSSTSSASATSSSFMFNASGPKEMKNETKEATPVASSSAPITFGSFGGSTDVPKPIVPVSSSSFSFPSATAQTTGATTTSSGTSGSTEVKPLFGTSVPKVEAAATTSGPFSTAPTAPASSISSFSFGSNSTANPSPFGGFGGKPVETTKKDEIPTISGPFGGGASTTPALHGMNGSLNSNPFSTSSATTSATAGLFGATSSTTPAFSGLSGSSNPNPFSSASATTSNPAVPAQPFGGCFTAASAMPAASASSTANVSAFGGFSSSGAPPVKSNPFGPATTTSTTSANPFGAASATPSNGLFVGASAAPAFNSNPFSTSVPPSSNAFGPSTGGVPFGNTAPMAPSPAGSMFGGFGVQTGAFGGASTFSPAPSPSSLGGAGGFGGGAAFPPVSVPGNDGGGFSLGTSSAPRKIVKVRRPAQG
jgi:hypothetical protein